MGATIPLIPYFLGNHPWNLTLMIGLGAFSLFSIGALLSLFTNRNALLSGLRMLLIGSTAGVVTYLVGSVLGVTLN
jgi:VIT1/CCC1 family predicted Fe2+/Mn2+ transporter